MVSTRRMAQTGVEGELTSVDPTPTLKKKPVRKATAKSAKVEAKPRATRGRKAQTELETGAAETADELGETDVPRARSTRSKTAEPEGPQEDDSQNLEPAVSTIRKKPGRPKNTEAGETPSITIEEPVVSGRVSRSTKASTLRGEKGAALIEAPVLSAPATSKFVKSIQEETEKPKPLSPKKITQVSKPNARSTRGAGKKAIAKVGLDKAHVRGRGTIKKRTVSDENNDISDLPPFHDLHEDGTELLASTPINKRSLRSHTPRYETAVNGEVSVTSHSTSPADRTGHMPTEDDELGDGTEDDNDEAESASAAGTKDDVTPNGSEDELCGPKTPMRRTDSAAEARYHASVQHTIRKYEGKTRVEGPPRRLAVSSSQYVTPRTVKPRQKHIPPTSALRPMTVARATDRAFVFKDLEQQTPLVEAGKIEEDLDESFIPDESIIPGIAELQPNKRASILPPGQILMSDALGERLVSDHSAGASADEEQVADRLNGTIVVDSNEELVEEEDPNETIVVDDGQDVEDCDPSNIELQQDDPSDAEDTVIITRAEHNVTADTAMSEDTGSGDGSVIVHEQPTSPMPETLVWDSVVAEALDSMEVVEPYECSLVQTVEETMASAGSQITSMLEQDNVRGAYQELQEAQTDAPNDRRISSTCSGRAERISDASINFNEFIDLAALSEPTQALDLQVAMEAEALEGEVKPTDEIIVPMHTLGTTEDLVMEDVDTVEFEASIPFFEQEPADEAKIPHYALPTVAFDARRKSLPVIDPHTPGRGSTRPNTSDGASAPKTVHGFTGASWMPVMPMESRNALTQATPATEKSVKLQETPGLSTCNSPAKPQVVSTPKERFPRFAPRGVYDEHAKTVAARSRFVDAEKPEARRQTFHKALPGNTAVVKSTPKRTPIKTSAAAASRATPQATPGERYPRLGQSAVVTPQTTPNENGSGPKSRQTSGAHAKTVAGPVRFRTPAKTSNKRPATTQKPMSLRKAALTASTPLASRTPTKTPSKVPAATPLQAPMTPHPSTPLISIVALVEIFTSEGASASGPFVALLHRLGAKTTRAWSDRITHVIFKDGSPTTLQRVRLHNKDVEESGEGTSIQCVNSRWVSDCESAGERMDEADEAYAVDIAGIPRGGKRRRKSMEPSALMNLGGNIVRDRKSSFGRSSMRSSLTLDSTGKQPEMNAEVATPTVDAGAGAENVGEEESSPVTPAWIAAPSQLVQQTAPMKRFRKLELKEGRRLTFWTGGTRL